MTLVTFVIVSRTLVSSPPSHCPTTHLSTVNTVLTHQYSTQRTKPPPSLGCRAGCCPGVKWAQLVRPPPPLLVVWRCWRLTTAAVVKVLQQWQQQETVKAVMWARWEGAVTSSFSQYYLRRQFLNVSKRNFFSKKNYLYLKFCFIINRKYSFLISLEWWRWQSIRFSIVSFILGWIKVILIFPDNSWINHWGNNI